VACGMWHVACGMWHVACGMWHVACGMWHVAYGMWHVACGTLKKVSKNFASTTFFPKWRVIGKKLLIIS
jgi:hypothetical protein